MGQISLPLTGESMQCLHFSIWLLSLNTVFSIFIQVAARQASILFFFWLNNIPLHTYTFFFFLHCIYQWLPGLLLY